MSPAQLIAELSGLQRELADTSRENDALDGVDPAFRDSALNLLHYLALRRRDLRPLQEQLSRYGLSSLGRAEPHVLVALQTVLRALSALAIAEGVAVESVAIPDLADGVKADWDVGPALLQKHAEALLGPRPARRSARIMVTMPSEAADDPQMVCELLRRGMDCMRINCAHDDPAAWLRMIQNLRQAERELGRSCRVSMDLAGPKLRTGPLAPLPGVVKVRPQRDDLGRVVAPVRVLLHAAGTAPLVRPSDLRLPVSGDALKQLEPGDRLRFRDARNAARSLLVVSQDENGWWAEARQTCYFVAGVELRVPSRLSPRQRLVVDALPPRTSVLLLRAGDSLRLTRSLTPGRPAELGPGGSVLTPASIGCTLPEIFEHLAPGQRVLFDDGRIAGVVRSVERDAVQVQITRTRPGGAKLQSDKGINLPDTPLNTIPALTAKDLTDLSLVCKHADIVALSFANSPRDVRLLLEAIGRSDSGHPAIILKIETRRGFENLPAMLLEAMRTPACGVMIARGDLAVECGFERLAELQEEILWICEAAHVPVIWATQVLEGLAKEGLPSRAEITDAAMGDRAECVMLNKGPHVLRAVQSLDDILQRMHSHQSKKRSMLRGLRLAHNFFAEAENDALADRG